MERRFPIHETFAGSVERRRQELRQELIALLGTELHMAAPMEGQVQLLEGLGADRVIDYRQEDFTKNGETYDVIIDVIGQSPFSRSIRSLKPKGRYVLGNPSIASSIRARWTRMTMGKKVIVAIARYKPEYYTFLKELMEAGKLKSVIDRRYPLEQLAEAHRYVEAGYKKGNVVITVAQ